jgi:hypothetical protein
MDRWIVSSGVALLHAGHKMGLMCTFTVYLHNHLFCIRPGFMAVTFFCVACILVEVVWSYRLLFIAEYQLASDLFISNLSVPPMAYECRTSSKVRKIQKFSIEKTIPYPEFELRTSQLVVDNLNHCTIRSVYFIIFWVLNYSKSKFCFEHFED